MGDTIGSGVVGENGTSVTPKNSENIAGSGGQTDVVTNTVLEGEKTVAGVIENGSSSQEVIEIRNRLAGIKDTLAELEETQAKIDKDMESLEIEKEELRKKLADELIKSGKTRVELAKEGVCDILYLLKTATDDDIDLFVYVISRAKVDYRDSSRVNFSLKDIAKRLIETFEDEDSLDRVRYLIIEDKKLLQVLFENLHKESLIRLIPDYIKYFSLEQAKTILERISKEHPKIYHKCIYHIANYYLGEGDKEIIDFLLEITEWDFPNNKDVYIFERFLGRSSKGFWEKRRLKEQIKDRF